MPDFGIVIVDKNEADPDGPMSCFDSATKIKVGLALGIILSTVSTMM